MCNKCVLSYHLQDLICSEGLERRLWRGRSITNQSYPSCSVLLNDHMNPLTIMELANTNYIYHFEYTITISVQVVVVCLRNC